MPKNDFRNSMVDCMRTNKKGMRKLLYLMLGIECYRGS